MRHLTLFVLVGVVSLSLHAQQDREVAVSLGESLGSNTTSGQRTWKLDDNIGVVGGYGVGSGVMVIGYYDHNAFSFQGTHHDRSHTSGNFTMNSLLLGVKANASIPATIASPYFLAAIGVSWAKPNGDSLITFDWPTDRITQPVSGSTTTFMGAVGVDISIYKWIFAYGEIRASAGLDDRIYAYLVLYRAGIGIALN